MNDHIPENFIPDDDTMELLCILYCNMGEDEIESWSLQAAEQLVQDQHTYEIEHGLKPKEYDPKDVYEVIQAFIQQDAENR